MQPFPLQHTIAEAYRDVFGHLTTLVRASGIWILIPVVLLGAAGLVLPPIQLPSAPGEPIIIPYQRVLAELVSYLLWLLGISAVVVYWHRRLLLKDEPHAIMAPVTSTVLRYMAASFLLVLLIAITVVLLNFVLSTLLAGPGGKIESPVGTPVLRLIAFVIGAVLLARIHLFFPAMAVRDLSMSFARSFKLTAGYTAPIFLGLIACSLPITIVGSVLQTALFALGGAGSLTVFAFSTATNFLQAAVIAAFLSLSYKFFTTKVARHPTSVF